MIINVDAEVNKHKTCTDRGQMERTIQDYKNLALQHASNIALAGQYNLVAHKLREICDRLPAPKFKNIGDHSQNTPVKTVNINNKEAEKIEEEWEQKARNARKP